MGRGLGTGEPQEPPPPRSCGSALVIADITRITYVGTSQKWVEKGGDGVEDVEGEGKGDPQ